MTVPIKKDNFTVYGQCTCLICGEAVPIYSLSERGYYKVCNKCKGAVMKFNKYTGKYMPEDSDFDSPVFAVMFGIGLVAVIVVFILAACSVFK